MLCDIFRFRKRGGSLEDLVRPRCECSVPSMFRLKSRIFYFLLQYHRQLFTIQYTLDICIYTLYYFFTHIFHLDVNIHTISLPTHIEV